MRIGRGPIHPLSMNEPIPIDEQLTPEEARAIIHGGLGKAELELVTSFCAPLYWALPDSAGGIRSRNGTAFFLDTGERMFGVTAWHVVDGWRKSRVGDGAGPLRLGGNGSSVELDWDARVIEEHSGIDIATFVVGRDEVALLGKTVLTGYQKAWPPAPPKERCGIYYCGYPGVGTRHPSIQEVIFGAVPGSGIASSVNERDVSTLIERQYLMPVLGGGTPPENFDLAGVIYQGPNPSEDPAQAIVGLEIIKARRADFIRPNGRLDQTRWGFLS
jgi:hypothetical protein